MDVILALIIIIFIVYILRTIIKLLIFSAIMFDRESVFWVVVIAICVIYLLC